MTDEKALGITRLERRQLNDMSAHSLRVELSSAGACGSRLAVIVPAAAVCPASGRERHRPKARRKKSIQ